MEINTSLQNGQESKENADIGDSPHINSTGRESTYYANSGKNFFKPHDFSGQSQRHQCYTEHQEDSSLKAEFGSSAQKYTVK